MCGICGVYDKKPVEIPQDIIVKMRDVMTDRGPDDAGLYIAPHIGLGHRRLSIIDLSPAGHQPMTNEDKTIWIVCNGEIYNFADLRDALIQKGHKFGSQSDTEVLIHGYEEWGIENLLQKINGMYAFAIWDCRKKELILARDRLGVKPLFYMEHKGKVFFSSDIKSIWLVHDKDLTLRHEAIDHFLYSACIPQEYSIFKEVNKVLPAHYIIFNKDRKINSNYWELSFAIKENKSENEFIEELTEKLMLSTRRRMISDVPLGAFLSGGVDSSLIVAMMAMISDSPVKTFSIGFNNESFNELQYARIVAQKYSTDHHEFIIEPNALSILPNIIWSFGEPFADSSQIPTYYVSKITRQYVTVAMTGDGGDESFGGYDNIVAQYFGAKYRRYLPFNVRSKLFPIIADTLISLFGRKGIISKIKTITEYGAGNFIDSLRNENIFGLEYRDHLYSSEFKDKLSGHNPTDVLELYSKNTDGKTEIDKALYVDIKTQLPDDFLTKVDIASMMNALEARSPFLDYELIEFAARIPADVKVKYGQQKYLLKKLASNFIPNKAIYRKKQGFGVPIGSWFKDNFPFLIRKILLNEKALKRGYFSINFINKLVDDHLTGRCDHTQRLWTLLCLELWHLIFIDKVITANTNLNELNNFAF